MASKYNDNFSERLESSKLAIMPLRSEYETQIDRALVCRLRKDWQLFPMEEWDRYKIPEYYWESLDRNIRPGRIHYVYKSGIAQLNEELLLSILSSRFPLVFKIMEMYPGMVFPCGGFFTDPWKTHDIDLFFVNCTPEQGNEIISAFKKIFIEHSYNKNKYRETINKVYPSVTNFSYFNMEYKEEKSYQFIHRVYPSLGHVLGGFDLSCSMIGFNGTKIVATEQGAWAFMNKCIVVDISRRSLSFEHRLIKYHSRGFEIIFPGIRQLDLLDSAIPKKSELAFFEELRALKEKYNMTIGKGVRIGSSDYGYGVKAESDKFFYTEKEYSPIKGFFMKPKKWFTILTLRGRIDIPDDFKPLTIKKASKQNLAVTDYQNEFVDTKGFEVLAPREIRPRDQGFGTDPQQPTQIQSPVVLGNVQSLIANQNLPAQHNAVQINPFGYQNIPPATLPTIPQSPPQNLYFSYPTTQNIPPINSRYQDPEENQMAVTVYGDKEWMTQDPQRQWSSTINPCIVKAQEFYMGRWNGFEAIISRDSLLTLQILRKRGDNVWSLIGRDIFTYIIMLIPYV